MPPELDPVVLRKEFTKNDYPPPQSATTRPHIEVGSLFAWGPIGSEIYRVMVENAIPYREAVEATKCAVLRAALRDTGGNRTRAAKKLRIGRQSMYNIIYRNEIGVKKRSVLDAAEAARAAQVASASDTAALPEDPIDDEFEDGGDLADKPEAKD